MAIKTYLLHFSYKLLYFAEVIIYAKWNRLIYASSHSELGLPVVQRTKYNNCFLLFTNEREASRQLVRLSRINPSGGRINSMVNAHF